MKARGYPTTEAGIRQALLDGYGSALVERDERVVLVSGAEAVKVWEDASTDASLSFPVNPPLSAMLLTIERYPDGEFVVDAISTDGGSLPRNVAIERTMALVRFGALSMADAVRKLSVNPARMLGLRQKGHLSPGADADITIIDEGSGRATMSLVAGEVIMMDGRVVGTGGTWFVTAAGEDAARRSGLPYQVLDLAESQLYAGWN